MQQHTQAVAHNNKSNDDPTTLKLLAEIEKLRAEIADFTDRHAIEAERVRIEQVKLQNEQAQQGFESQRIQIEKDKLQIERKRMLWTALAVVVPLAVIAATFFTTSLSQRQQAEAQIDIKIVESIASAKDVTEATSRANALRRAFPERMKRLIGDKLSSAPDPGSVRLAEKKELLNLIAAHPEGRMAIIETWYNLFPADNWVHSLMGAGSNNHVKDSSHSQPYF